MGNRYNFDVSIFLGDYNFNLDYNKSRVWKKKERGSTGLPFMFARPSFTFVLSESTCEAVEVIVNL